MISTSASALDTDIYFDPFESETPNIMFYFDTSGSMRSRVNNVPQPYNKDLNYSGPFDSGRYYLSPIGRIPNTPTGVINVPPERMHCGLIDWNWGHPGFMTDSWALRMIQPDPANSTPTDMWLSPTVGNWSATDHFITECSNDRPHFDYEQQGNNAGHGSNPGSAHLYGHGNYASSAPGPAFTGNANHALDWSAFPYYTIFRGNFLNYKANPPIEDQSNRSTRMDVVKKITYDLIHLFRPLNIGVANMFEREGGTILQQVGTLDNLSNLINIQRFMQLNAAGATPLAEGLHEIYRYFRGDPWLHAGGQWSIYRSFSGHNWRHEPGVQEAAPSGLRYHSPITNECQRSHVIMLTDGAPNQDDAQHHISALPNFGSITGTSGSCHSPNYNSTDKSCLDELAAYMAKADAAPWLPNVEDIDQDGNIDGQTVMVHPVGFATDYPLLQAVADAAGTTYYTANDAETLEQSLINIIANTVNQTTATSSLVTSSDQFGRISHRDEVYVSLFNPSSKFQWRGNIKKYRIATDANGPYLTDTDTINNPRIVGSDGKIDSDAQSYWSNSPDGSVVLKGGAHEKLKAKAPTARTVFGRNNSSTPDLRHPTHALTFANPEVNAAIGLHGQSSAFRQDVLNYALGQDVKDQDRDSDTTDGHGNIGAMPRNQPIVVQYGGNSSNPQTVIFAPTSNGVLHGFDGETGEEIFAWSPLESVAHFGNQYLNQDTGKNRWWGLDGKLSAHVIDRNRDGIVNKAEGDKVTLTVPFGLGGRELYVLDVTEANNPSNPKIVEVARHDPTTSNRWAEMGYMLDKPTPFKLRTASGSTNMLATSMGYDLNAELSYTGHTMGRGLAIVRSDDASIHWSGLSNASTATADSSYSNMDFAFVASPTTVDTNGDGFADRLYAVDLGAQVWRFDLNEPFARRSSGAVDGDILARLGGNSLGDQRQVFKSVKAAHVQESGNQYVALALGTGNRMHPLESRNNNRIYVLKDKFDSVDSTAFSTITNSDLYDATDNTIGETSNSNILLEEYQKLRDADGWYVDLPGDQKAISGGLISDGIVTFPAYTLPSNGSPCTYDIGKGSVYRMSLFDAKPVTDLNNDGDLDTSEREIQLSAQGIPPDAVVHRDEDGRLSVCVGLECQPSDPNADPTASPTKVHKNYWHTRQ